MNPRAQKTFLSLLCGLCQCNWCLSRIRNQDGDSYSTVAAIHSAPRPTFPASTTTDASTFSQLLRDSTVAFFHGIVHLEHVSIIGARTKEFTSHVRTLARLPGGHDLAMETFIWFSLWVLPRSDSCFYDLLYSQQCNVYWLLDEAMLGIALEKWTEEEYDPGVWDVERFIRCIETGKDALSEAPGRDAEYPSGRTYGRVYFSMTVAFLRESMMVARIRDGVEIVSRGCLPQELKDEIAWYIMDVEGLPRNLRAAHDRRGSKEKVGRDGWICECCRP